MIESRQILMKATVKTQPDALLDDLHGMAVNASMVACPKGGRLRIWEKPLKFVMENIRFAYGSPYGWPSPRRRVATGWLRQILREFTGLWRSGAAHPR